MRCGCGRALLSSSLRQGKCRRCRLAGRSLRRQVTRAERLVARAQRRQARLEAPVVAPAPRKAPIVAPEPAWRETGLVSALLERAGEFDFWEGSEPCPF